MTILNGSWHPPTWEDVYFEDATDVLLDLCDAVDDNPAGIDLQGYCHRLVLAARGPWAVIAVLAQPVLVELCNAVAIDGDVSLEPYRVRLAAAASRLREPMTISAAAFASLTPAEATQVLNLSSVRLF